MTRGTKVRLLAFLVLSALGVVYVAGSFLGITDRLLGRGMTIHATLPTSGGLYTGSEVTVRGVKVGQVSGMDVTADGVRLRLAIKDAKTRIPMDSPMYVHNLSAVGEQYLDFEPPDNKAPYARAGDTIAGNASSLPISEEQLLTQMDAMVRSVDGTQLSTVVSELGTMFHGTANPLQHMVDSGSRFVDEAAANKEATLSLFDTGHTVLQTQAEHERDITAFASGLADLSGTLRASDKDLRTILQGGPGAMREVDSLLKGLEPTLPVFMSNLVTTNQVLTANLPGLEQTLVTFPRVISSGFTGTPGDGYGHINLQLNNTTMPCSKGYLPRSRWRPASDLSDKPIYPARCLSGPPINMRGTKYAPRNGSAASNGRSYRVAPYDARTGKVDPASSGDQGLVMGDLHTVFGDDSWKYLLIGSVTPGD